MNNNHEKEEFCLVRFVVPTSKYRLKKDYQIKRIIAEKYLKIGYAILVKR